MDGEGGDPPLAGRLGPLQDEQDPERFGRDARMLLADAGPGSVETRVRVTAGVVRLGPRAGDAFCAELLRGVPALARAGRAADGRAVRADALTLVAQSPAPATSLTTPALFNPLVAEAVELIRTERGASAPGGGARLTVRCERGFRVLGLRTEARSFLTDTAGQLPTAADPAALRAAAGGSWPDAARTRLAGAGMRPVAGQTGEAGRIAALVRAAVLDPPAGPLNNSYSRLVAEFAATAGRLPPPEAKQRLEEGLVKSARPPDTFTTATQYSRYHLMILEAAVLGLPAPKDF
ncbi:MAG: hypothetical protein JWO38_2786 [Gemmataceae bacterium]|nr:hypothetical protein [Gemmataceae bacterium]